MIAGKICRDYGDVPGCLGDPDERFTMRFDTIGQPPIYWCAHCGPEAKKIDEALKRLLESGAPEDVKAFESAVDEATEKMRREAH